MRLILFFLFRDW